MIEILCRTVGFKFIVIIKTKFTLYRSVLDSLSKVLLKVEKVRITVTAEQNYSIDQTNLG